MGHLDRQRMATVLFDTDRLGAQALLDDIQRNGSAALQKHISAIHSYSAVPVDDMQAPGTISHCC